MFAPRRYVMTPPIYFDVVYEINPWMNTSIVVNRNLAIRQWMEIYDALVVLGHNVILLEPQPGLPDMVFTANAGFAIGNKMLVSNFRYAPRAGESVHFAKWFDDQDFMTTQALATYEGEGDFLFVGGKILAGTGFRTSIASHREAAAWLNVPVITLELVDPKFYHLDTALAVLSNDLIMYFPEAFSEESREVLDSLYPTAIKCSEEDALCFGINALSDGSTVLLGKGTTELKEELVSRGFGVLEFDVSELLKAGGGVKCCVLELH